jgi:elongation factor Ts
MAEITAADVNKLRKATGAGMMDCKKALQEAGGDFEEAVTIIRKKGQLVASKRADREATEGVVIAKAEGKKAVLLLLSCETDFVAKNENFVKLAYRLLDHAYEKMPADSEALKVLPFEGKTVGERIVEEIGIIGEKLDIGFFGKIEAEDVVSYIHPGNKLATIAGFNKKVDQKVAKDISMQIAAMSPVAVDKDDVPSEIIEKEKEIGRDQARNEGKPENMLDKIAEGKLNKFFKESTLLNQDFTKDNKKTVRQYLKESDPGLTVTKFIRFSLK